MRYSGKPHRGAVFDAPQEQRCAGADGHCGAIFDALERCLWCATQASPIVAPSSTRHKNRGAGADEHGTHARRGKPN